jgi:IclR family acetate operon transcriptional repressor
VVVDHGGHAADAFLVLLVVDRVATVVYDHTSAPCAAISVSGPSARILHADTSELGALLVRHAGEMSAALGHRPGLANAAS